MDARWLPAGITLLPMSAFAYAWAVLQRGHLLAPGSAGFDAWVAGEGFALYATTTLLVTVTSALSVLALAAWISPATGPAAPTWGVALATPGLLCGMAITALLAVAWPLGVAAEVIAHPAWRIMAPASIVLFTVGGLVLAWALRQTGLVWQASLLALGFLCLATPFWHWVEFAGALITGLASAAVAWPAWTTRQRPTLPLPPP